MLWRKLTAFFENSIHIVFFIIALISSFFTVIHFPQYDLHFQHSIPETILSAFIAALIFFLWDRLLKNKTKKATAVIYLITCGLLLSLQIFLFLKVATPIGWDVMEVLNSAEFGMYNGDYFAKYPNNLTLRLFLSLYLKATSFLPFLSYSHETAV